MALTQATLILCDGQLWHTLSLQFSALKPALKNEHITRKKTFSFILSHSDYVIIIVMFHIFKFLE